MRGIRTAGLGLAAALSSQSAFGQNAGRPAATFGTIRPAATFGAITPAAGPITQVGLVARGQTGSMPLPMPTGAPVGQPVGLAMPRAMAAPSVTEVRAGTSVPTGSGVPTGPGQPYVVGVGQPYVVGQPTSAGQPFPSGQPFPAGQQFPSTQSFPTGQTFAGQPFPTGQTYPAQTPIVTSPTPVVGQSVPVAGPVGVPSVFPAEGFFGTGPTPVPDSPLYGGGYGGGYGGYMSGPTGLLTGGGRLQVSADYLLWWVKNGTQPTLLTTGPAASRGIIGQPGTQSVAGGPSMLETLHGGGRFAGTYWLGQRQVWGVSGDIFFLARNGTSNTYNSGQYPVLARPFYNLNTNANDSELVGFPGLLNGQASITTDLAVFGGGVDVRRKLLGACGGCNSLDALIGFRGMRLTEGLTISEAIATAPGVTLPNNAIFSTVSDQFKTENEFYGANFGLAGEMRRGRWFLGGKASIAVGDVFQKVEINGGQTLVTNTGTSVVPGGLYALPGSNIGTFTQNKFAVLPEVGLQLGYYLTPHWRVAVGYNFLYLSNVIRPGDQIDTGLDVTRIPNFNLPGGPNVTPLPYPRPAPTLKETDIFLQGISFSVQFTW